MVKKSLWALALLIIVTTAILALRGPSSSKNQLSSQILRVNFTADPPTLDPRKGGDATSSTVQFMLFEGLTRNTPETTAAPAIAERFELSADKLRYTFYLRESKWSDGSPLVAYDFEKAWKDMLTPSFPCPNANLLYPIKNAEKAKSGEVPLDEVGVSAIDDHTLVVDLEHPCPYFLELTSFCVFFPVKHELSESNPNWAERTDSTLISNGPFTLEKWRHNDELRLVKNPLYWENEVVQLDGIQVSLINDEMTALEMFEKNEIDILGSPFTEIPLDILPKLANDGKLKKHELGATSMCSFNLSRFPFNNQNIRKAFALATNRKAIVEHITQGGEIPGTGIIPPILKNGRDVSFYQDHNPEKALYHFNLGLKELGIEKKDLGKIVMEHDAKESQRKVAQALQQQWKEVLGVNIELQKSEFKVFLTKLTQRDFHMALGFWIAQYNDPMNIFDRFKFAKNPKNFPGWENRRYISLLNSSMHAQSNEERMALLDEAEKIIVEETPLFTVYHWNDLFLEQPYLKNFHVSPIGSIHLGWASVNQASPKNDNVAKRL